MPRNVALGNPVVNPHEDEFNRWPFSRALAEQIAMLGNPDGSPVVGLYGRGGYGKSSVLKFVKYHLEQNHSDNVVLLEFNPWIFKGEEILLTSFYASLAEKMDESLDGVGKKVGDLLAGYSGALGMLPFVGAGAKTLAEQFGRQLSEVRLEERRKQIFEIMRDAKRTVIVLIDDLDRLDGNEIATMLKVVCLTANIPNVVYVLAFDDEVVAHALSPVYGKYHEAGRLFLEKVIQFPFVIPAVGQDRLADYVLRHARDAAQRAGIVMHDADWSAFRDLTSHHLSRRLTTPRQAIRYGSALDFALPMLRGEVNPLQQLVVEAIRILFPELYVHIRDNRNAFIGDNISEEGIAQQVHRAMEAARQGDKEAACAILVSLFVGKVAPQAIHDPRYFDRQFGYALTSNDIADAEMLLILDSSLEESEVDPIGWTGIGLS